MRLIDTETLELVWFNGPTSEYAILSHTWGDDEVSLQEFQQPGREHKSGFQKIKGCCRQAHSDGIKWAWVDTCCIDKTNSAELSEAVNSMYSWYWGSYVCYAFLEDVPPRQPSFPDDAFSKARWFQRGWCLQELIAPSKVEFYARDWTEIGTKWSLEEKIALITRIPRSVLSKRYLHNHTIAEKMSWASRRSTTRIEDSAYCLMGIFDIHMPLIYGEGQKAFARLQTAILSQSEDYSFLIWTPSDQSYIWGSENARHSVMASSAAHFSSAGPSVDKTERPRYEHILPFSKFHPSLSNKIPRSRQPPQLTGRGLRVQMLAQKIPMPLSTTWYLLWTEHTWRGMNICVKVACLEEQAYSRAAVDNVFLVDDTQLRSFELLELFLTTNARGPGNPPRGKRIALNRDLLILSSKFNHKIRLLGHNLKLPNNKEVTEAFDHTLWEKILYCPDIESHIRRYRLAGMNRTLSFQLEIQNGGVVSRFNVNLWLEPQAPRCHIWNYADNMEYAKASIWSSAGDYELSTDRAEYELTCDELMASSCFVTVTVKSQLSSVSAYYKVYINVLGGT
jgi:hypothetical protein